VIEMSWWVYVVGFAAACLLSVLLTPLVKKVALRAGAVSVPNHRSVHTKPMPLWGGLAIFLAFIGAYFIIAPAFGFEDKANVALGLILGGAVIVIVGALDDRYDLSPKMKLLGQIAAAIIVVSFGLKIDVVNIPFYSQESFAIPADWISIPLTILWIVGVSNAINLIDGLDGLSAGVSGIATATLLVMAALTGLMGNEIIILLCAILFGSTLGFLFFNFHPAKIFMGDAGALFLGFSLATLSIMGYKQATVVSFIVPVLILGVPLSDTFLAIVRRKLNNKPISVADKGHLHHCLMRLGFGMRKTVLIIYAISIVFGMCAVLLTKVQGWVAIVITVLVLFVLEIGVEAIGMISKKRKPVIQLIQRLYVSVSRPSK
jgi:UDP-GlcNAc:undecaprenyl-phosphate GlcNAc-1-phosphate transferase